LKLLTVVYIAFACIIGSIQSSAWADDAVQFDATDPTKIYSFLGGGPKHADYTNGEYMWEFRLIGNLSLGSDDMLLIEAGYGRHFGETESGSQSDWTNARARWFHLFDMDYDLAKGFRGLGSQLDIQMAGRLNGTDGQNVINVGPMPVWALSESWNFYLTLNLVNSWDKQFAVHNGVGAGFDAQLIFNPDWWPGSQVRFMPAYSYFMGGELKDEGSGNLDLNVGGEFNSATMWDVTVQQNFDRDLSTYRRSRETDLKNDWNVFFNVTRYF